MPKIVSLIHRAGGSFISLPDPVTRAPVEYHFTGPANKPHVCDVTVAEHVARLLEITEGFALADGEKAPKAAPVADPVPPYVPVNPETANVVIDIVAQPLPDDVSIDAADPDPAEQPMTITQARKLYKAKTGKNPSPRLTIEQLIAKLDTAE